KRLAAQLGPWAVSGPALAVGTQALADRSWIEGARQSLDRSAARLDGILRAAKLDCLGGTSLFRLTGTPKASGLFIHLGRAGILARAFAEHPAWLRFGLPASEPEWQRLQNVFATWTDKD